MNANRSIFRRALVAAMTVLLAGGAAADEERRSEPLGAAYVEECGSCHVAFPPGLLGRDSWRAVMAGLEKHFGSDASLEAARTAEIGAWLETRAGRRDEVDRAGQPLLRISQTRWFQREHRDGHDGITAGVWQSEAVKTPANCAACHRDAAAGDYSERNIRIPALARR